MELALAFIGLPVATYLILAALSPGRTAWIGIIVALMIAAGAWVMQMSNGDSYTVALIMLIISAIALAGLVQLIRRALGPDRPRWAYPLTVLLALLVAGIPAMNILGV